MGVLEYRRSELSIVFQRQGDGGVLGRVQVRGFSSGHAFGPKDVERWVSGTGPTREELASALKLDEALKEFQALGSELRLESEEQEQVLERVVLDLRDERLAALDWEQLLGAPFPLVRVTVVRPRVERIPLTLPLRVVSLDSGQFPHDPIEQEVAQAFGSLAGRPEVMSMGSCSLEELESFREKKGWPTAEVLHFVRPLTFLEAQKTGRLLSTAFPQQAGTLGWLLRLADSWQTRLVVLVFASEQEARALRRLAHALVGRGGPAVLVMPGAGVGLRAPLYEKLLHDQPLDAWSEPLRALFGGAGREDLLRVSSIVRQLSLPEVWEEFVRESPGPEAALREEFKVLGPRLQGLTFDHEREGMLSLSATLGQLRGMVQVKVAPAPVQRPTSFESLPRGPTPQVLSFSQRPLASNVQRHVNALLHIEGSNGRLQPLEVASARVAPEQVVHLSVQIGAKDTRLPVIGSTALLMEQLHWTVGAEGLFLQVGITGMDFDVLGAPVQELWLPRQRESDDVVFALTLKQTTRLQGVARLRLCLYQHDNLLQSLRLAVLVQQPGQADPKPRERARRLAAALEVQEAEVRMQGQVGYLTRVEYNSLGELKALPAVPPRRLSFVVNQSAGEEVVTVKGQDLFAVQQGGNQAGPVQALRTVLFQSSMDVRGEYRFFHNDELNRGDPGHLAQTLLKLARHGWDLFTQLVGSSEDAIKRVRELLAADGQVIQAAHVHLENVIPWALVYDRAFDADRQSPEPVACLASLPGPDGTPGARRCGEAESCPLHVSKREASGHREDTVVCPRHFWGFRHVVEVPPQQTKGLKGTAPPPVASAISCASPVQVVTAQHRGLKLAQKHFQAFSRLLGSSPLDTQLHPAARRDELMDLLRQLGPAPDIVYLYCHARAQPQPGGNPKEPNEPHLELGPADKVGWITAPQIAGLPSWRNRPLFFLNGCSTAAFASTKPAQLILNLMARQAGGIIGTEVTIWEGLAGEMALYFFQHFLQRRSAGEALLEARRALLAKYNPLGLVYTLYGSADLKLVPLENS